MKFTPWLDGPRSINFLQERRAISDAHRDGRFARVGHRFAIAVPGGGASRGKVALRHVLDVDEHHRLFRQVLVSGDKTARPFNARRVVAGTGHEHQRAGRSVGELAIVPRQGHQYRRSR